jgi:hypothetical protein
VQPSVFSTISCDLSNHDPHSSPHFWGCEGQSSTEQVEQLIASPFYNRGRAPVSWDLAPSPHLQVVYPPTHPCKCVNKHAHPGVTPCPFLSHVTHMQKTNPQGHRASPGRRAEEQCVRPLRPMGTTECGGWRDVPKCAGLRGELGDATDRSREGDGVRGPTYDRLRMKKKTVSTPQWAMTTHQPEKGSLTIPHQIESADTRSDQDHLEGDTRDSDDAMNASSQVTGPGDHTGEREASRRSGVL